MKAQKNALLPTQRNITSANLEREEGVKNGLAPNKLHIQDQVWQQLDQDCVVVHIAPGSLARSPRAMDTTNRGLEAASCLVVGHIM